MEQEGALQFLEYLVRGIVKNVEKAILNESQEDGKIIIEVQVDKDDMGRLIGRNGHTIKSIRTLVRLFGIRNNVNVGVRIVDPA